MARARLVDKLHLGSADEDGRLVNLVGYVGFALTIVSFVLALLTAVQGHQWGYAAAWGIPILVGMYPIWVILHRETPASPPPTDGFKPFGQLSEDDDWRWPRAAELDALLEAVTPRVGTPERDGDLRQVTVVVGSSGMGKTTLLRQLLPRKLQLDVGTTGALDDPEAASAIRYVYMRGYEMTRASVTQALSVRGRIVVLDQLEQHLAWLQQQDPNARDEEQKWLYEQVKYAEMELEVTVILGLRREWYFNLRFLGDLLPPLEGAIELGPVKDSREDPARQSIVRQFQRTLSVDTSEAERIVESIASERDGVLIPLEVQIVGASLERARKDHHAVSAKSLAPDQGGVAGLINTYFTATLNGARDRRVALKVLCALSTRTRFRRQEDVNTLLEALYEDAGDVGRAIRYLEEEHLVVPVDQANERIELAHDYLAEVFQQMSAAKLDPTERDNVRFHIEELEEDHGRRRPTMVASRNTRERQAQERHLSRTILTVLAVLMGLRLLYLNLPWYVLNSGPRPHPLINHALLDETYLPIFPAHFAWAMYLGAFYDRVFRHLTEAPVDRFLSRLPVMVILPSSVVAMLIPYTWVLSISVCGLAIAVKMLSMASGKDVNAAAQERLKSMGWITLSNMVLAGLVGGLIFYLSIALAPSPVHHPGALKHYTESWTLLMIPWSVLLTAACVALLPAHVRRNAAALMLGLLARPVTPIIPRPES